MQTYTNNTRRIEKGTEGLLEEIMAKNFPKLDKEIDIQIQETLPKSNQNEPKEVHIETH